MPDYIKLSDLINSMSIKIFFHLHKIKKSKKLVLIRPRKSDDDYTMKFSYPASDLVKARAVALGWDVTDLTGNDTGRLHVEETLKKVKPDLVIHYDHGATFTLFGVYNDLPEPAIDPANVSLLSGMAVSTVSCGSASGLGPLAISSSARAYLGYTDHTVEANHVGIFTEAANAANFALLDGKSFQEAYDAGYAKYTEKFNELVSQNDLGTASGVLHDRDSMTLLGDPSAEGYQYDVV